MTSSAPIMNDDINRHLLELDRKFPLPGPKAGGPSHRLRLDYVNRDSLNSQLDSTLTPLRTGTRIAPERVVNMEHLMRQHLRSLVDARNNYYDRAASLDAGRTGGGKVANLFASTLIFGLDVLSFTFTFAVLLESISSATSRIPKDLQEFIPIAAIVAIGASVAVKLLANGAAKNKGILVSYFLAWGLFATADISYLAKKGIANVGVAMTALLIVMSGATLWHAKSHTPSRSRKDLLMEYGEAHYQYQRKLAQWKHSIIRLQNEPELGIEEFLLDDVYDFSPQAEPAPTGSV